MPRPDDFTTYRQQLPLGEFPTEVVEITCGKCDRRGRLSRSKLIAEHGADVGLVSLLGYLSRDCPERKPDAQGIRRCGAHYVGLT